MADQFVAEIRIFPFNFAPTGWAMCNGQGLPISQNTALFSLLGTTYGGDGKSTFALPDLQGRAAMHPEQGPGLSIRDLGETGGSDTVTLLSSEIPVHTHGLKAAVVPANRTGPAGNAFARTTSGNPYHLPDGNPPLAALAGESLSPAGSSLPHNNLMPYLVINFCIALQGIFPPRH